MANTAETTERHQHKAPQCKSSDAGTICQEEACRHDHHISRHVEVSCAPAKGQSDLYDCVHTHN
ncbi:MAG TPA: hypothetical protein VMG98_14560 [Verrucomicrobiae bacterium]|nr:hypothetical protein [Verrucomicrobiae bacterium]